MPAHGRGRFEEMHLGLQNLRRHLLQGGDIKNPQAAPVRRGHNLSGRRVLRKIMHRHRRQIVIELHPRHSSIEGSPNREFRPQEK